MVEAELSKSEQHDELAKEIQENNVVVKNLKTYFFTSKGIVRAIENLSLSIRRGEVYGLVGESGSGKSVTATSIIDLIPDPPGRVLDGDVYINGFNIYSDLDKLVRVKIKSPTNVKVKHYKTALRRHNKILSSIRGKWVSMIFQEPFLSMNPVLTIGFQLTEPILLHNLTDLISSLVRLETFSKKNALKVAEAILGEPDYQKRSNIVDQFILDYSLYSVKKYIKQTAENISDPEQMATEFVNIAQTAKLGLKVEKYARMRDYFRLSDRVDDLQLKLVSIEGEIKRIRRRIQELSASSSAGSDELRKMRNYLDTRTSQSEKETLQIKEEIKRAKEQMRRVYPALYFKRILSKRVRDKNIRMAAEKRAIEFLELVNIPAPEAIMNSYPHELSGGMLQRSMIAMALSSSPKVLIADEPTTALDVTTQAQILNLINRVIDKRRGQSVLFITHDLAVIAEMCDRVGVMYGGNLVEEAPLEKLFKNAKHPYTIGLMNSIPRHDVKVDKAARLESIPGSVPNLIDPPTGCRFHPRCKFRMDICSEKKPALVEIEPEHKVACFLYSDEVEESVELEE